jgi:alpha-amylase
VEAHLDYIQAMGFDAIWISPIPVNTPKGYHGYWMQNLNAINDHFGSEAELLSLIGAAHQRDMFVMLDVVANHVGPVPNGNDFSDVVPFNDSRFYHDCRGCPTGCAINDFTCFQHEITHCRLVVLPDLNQSRPDVYKPLFDFAARVTQVRRLVVFTCVTFAHVRARLQQICDIDGFRIDTAPEVKPSFWEGFIAAGGGAFAVGEVFTSDVTCVATYANALGGVLSYPLFFALRDVFAQHQPMTEILQACARALCANALM